MVLLHYRVVPDLSRRVERDQPVTLAQPAVPAPEPCRPPESQVERGRAA